NQEIASLDSDLSFDKPDVFNLQEESSDKSIKENVAEEVQDLPAEEKYISTIIDETPVSKESSLPSDQEFLEAVIDHFELPDNFIVKQDETSTDLVKENFWGTETVLSMDGELEIYGAASVITEI